MPFIGLDSGRTVSPTDVDSNTTVECPRCNEGMHTRDRDGYRRHFVHFGDTDCNGESKEHRAMRRAVESKASEAFADGAVSTGQHVAIGSREADVLVEFDGPHPFFGDGICIEAQFKHHGKDKRAVERDYADAGYSTRWVSIKSFKISPRSRLPAKLESPILKPRLFGGDVHRLDRPEAPIYVTKHSSRSSGSRYRALSVNRHGALVFHRELPERKYKRLHVKYPAAVCQHLWPSRYEDPPDGWHDGVAEVSR